MRCFDICEFLDADLLLVEKFEVSGLRFLVFGIFFWRWLTLIKTSTSLVRVLTKQEVLCFGICKFLDADWRGKRWFFFSTFVNRYSMFVILFVVWRFGRWENLFVRTRIKAGGKWTLIDTDLLWFIFSWKVKVSGFGQPHLNPLQRRGL